MIIVLLWFSTVAGLIGYGIYQFATHRPDDAKLIAACIVVVSVSILAFVYLPPQ